MKPKAFALLAWCLVVCLTTTASSAKNLVGYQVVDFKLPGAVRPLTSAVWYPTRVRPRLYCYGGPSSGWVALNAQPDQGGPYPLLVFSHGYAGSGLGALFMTEALASRGWIVVAPDHHDRFSAARIRAGAVTDVDGQGLRRHALEIAASGPEKRDEYSYRLDEMKAALDGILSHPTLGPLVDRRRIAIGGHSFGGFTALGLCGPLPERRDSRVKALLLFSTGAGGYLYREDELKAVKIPCMCFLGEAEREQKRGNKTMVELTRKIYACLSPPKYLVEVQGADHFSFNNRFSDTLGARRMSGSEEQFQIIRRYSIAFLEKYLGAGDAAGVLMRQGPGLSDFRKKL